MTKLKFIKWINSIDDPDEVGGSEYRAIHEVLTSIDVIDHEDPQGLANSILEEFICHAKDLQDSLRKASNK